MNFKIYLQSSSKAMTNWRKRGKGRNTKIWISQEQESFLDEIKSIFQFLKGYHLVKK